MKTAMTLLTFLTLTLAIGVMVGCNTDHDDHTGHDHAAHQAERTAQDATEQTMCPVMDAPINTDYSVEYAGQTVYFCCPGCDKLFLEEPEKYLDKLPQFQK